MIINDFWQAIRPAIAIGKSKGYFDVPWNSEFIKSFSLFGRQAQNTPQVIWQWNYTSPNNFTLKFPITAPIVLGANPFILCIRYNVGNQVYRYKLWSTNGDSKIFAPLYAGQPIAKNFCIELWSLIIDTTGAGNDHGADNIIPSGSIYEPFDSEIYIPTIPKNDVQYYYYDSRNSGVVYLTQDGVVIPSGGIFIGTQCVDGNVIGQGCILNSNASEPVTAIIKFSPDITFDFTNVSDFRIYTSQLKTKVSFQDNDTFLAIPAGTQCIPWLPESNNLNNYPSVGTGVGALPITFKACVSNTNN